MNLAGLQETEVRDCLGQPLFRDRLRNADQSAREHQTHPGADTKDSAPNSATSYDAPEFNELAQGRITIYQR